MIFQFLVLTAKKILVLCSKLHVYLHVYYVNLKPLILLGLICDIVYNFASHILIILHDALIKSKL
jgi:hypothetical protein